MFRLLLVAGAISTFLTGCTATDMFVKKKTNTAPLEYRISTASDPIEYVAKFMEAAQNGVIDETKWSQGITENTHNRRFYRTICSPKTYHPGTPFDIKLIEVCKHQHGRFERLDTWCRNPTTDEPIFRVTFPETAKVCGSGNAFTVEVIAPPKGVPTSDKKWQKFAKSIGFENIAQVEARQRADIKRMDAQIEANRKAEQQKREQELKQAQLRRQQLNARILNGKGLRVRQATRQKGMYCYGTVEGSANNRVKIFVQHCGDPTGTISLGDFKPQYVWDDPSNWELME